LLHGSLYARGATGSTGLKNCLRDQFNLSGDFRGAVVHVGVGGRPDRLSQQAAWTRFAEMPLEGDPPGPAVFPAHSVMPWSANPLFVARRDVLARLAGILARGGGAAAVVQAAAAGGLGGIGKTQIAVEFVHRYGQYFAGGVFWINCGDPGTIAGQVAACGGPGRLDLHPHFDQLPLPDRIALVRKAWSDAYPRLLVFDNCETEETFATWRPSTGGARILLTARRSHWSAGLGVTVQQLDVLDRPDSLQLLTAFQPEANVAEEVLDQIAAELGDLPLALHMAGSFLARYRHAELGDPARYLARLRTQVLRHTSMMGGDWSPTGHDQHVARTFEVSYEDLDPDTRDGAGARQILDILCCYAPGELIPRAYITVSGDADEPDDVLQLAREDAFRRLFDVGLVEERGPMLVVHRLIVAFVRERIDPALRLAVEEEVASAAATSNRSQDGRYIADWEIHLAHMADAAIERGSPAGEELTRQLAMHYYVRGDYAACRAVNERRLARAEATLPEADEAVAAALNDFAVSIRPFAPDEALALLRRSIALQLKSPKQHEISLLMGHLNLGEALYGGDGAEEAFREARRRFRLIWDRHDSLENAERFAPEAEHVAVLPHHDPDDLWVRIICGLAKARHDGNAERDLLRDLLPEYPSAPEFRHWEVLQRLGVFRQEAGDLVGARHHLERARTIAEERFGQEAPVLGDLFFQLGSIYAAMRERSLARDAFQRAFELAHSALGWDHPATVACSNGLLDALMEIGAFPDIKAHMTVRLAYLEHHQGRDRELQHVLIALGFACFQTGDLGAAEMHWRRGLKIAKRDPIRNRDSIRVFNKFRNMLKVKPLRGLHARPVQSQR